MTEEEETADIYIPKKAPDPNTQRMAWLLFLERWKSYTDVAHDSGVEWAWGDKETVDFYEQALRMATIIRELEQAER